MKAIGRLLSILIGFSFFYCEDYSYDHLTFGLYALGSDHFDADSQSITFGAQSYTYFHLRSCDCISSSAHATKVTYNANASEKDWSIHLSLYVEYKLDNKNPHTLDCSGILPRHYSLRSKLSEGTYRIFVNQVDTNETVSIPEIRQSGSIAQDDCFPTESYQIRFDSASATCHRFTSSLDYCNAVTWTF